ncbi:MAG: hypothetical protein KKE20_01165 [Nanoarchaeota archaeon]|nr:hypothetical protein [Nanoarchaeota archaeon]
MANKTQSKMIILILLSASLFLTSCEDGKEHFMVGEPAEKAVLYVKIIDAQTQEPVEDALFYFGDWKFYHTDSEGKGSTDETSWGEHSINAYKKGYIRYSEPIRLERGDNSITIELQKDVSPPSDLSVEGKVTEEVYAEGSKSEAHFIKLRYDNGSEDYLFNIAGENRIDKDFIGKRVRVKGFRDKGYIGWWHEEKEGIYVEEIEAIGFWD